MSTRKRPLACVGCATELGQPTVRARRKESWASSLSFRPRPQSLPHSATLRAGSERSRMGRAQWVPKRDSSRLKSQVSGCEGAPRQIRSQMPRLRSASLGMTNGPGLAPHRCPAERHYVLNCHLRVVHALLRVWATLRTLESGVIPVSGRQSQVRRTWRWLERWAISRRPHRRQGRHPQAALEAATPMARYSHAEPVSCPTQGEGVDGMPCETGRAIMCGGESGGSRIRASGAGRTSYPW